VKLLLDANISWRSITPLKSIFEHIEHVDSISVLSHPAKDIEIWNYAKNENAIIITNDEDFYKLSVLKGFPPKIVIIRTGNQENSYLINLLIKHSDEIKKLSESTDYGILEIL